MFSDREKIKYLCVFLYINGVFIYFNNYFKYIYFSLKYFCVI